MRIILTKDIANLGKKFEIKEVADGYALNFLIPQGKAQFADPKTVADIERKRETEKTKLATQNQELKEVLGNHEAFTVSSKANEEGHLFAGIDASKIARVLSEALGREVDEASIFLDSPIKEVGVHEVKLKVGDEEVPVSVEVKAE